MIHKALLTPNLTGKLQFRSIVIQSGSSSGVESCCHEGEATGLVFDGILELLVDDQPFILEAGDSFRFDSMRMHRFSNAGETRCEVLWVSTPPFY